MDTELTEVGRERLRAALDQARLDLRITWAELARRCGWAKYESLRQILSGDRRKLTEDSKLGLEEGAGWKRGSVDLILAGGQPMLRPPDDGEPGQLGRGAVASLSELDTLADEVGLILTIEDTTGGRALAEQLASTIADRIREVRATLAAHVVAPRETFAEEQHPA